jgi:hypothetical protein
MIRPGSAPNQYDDPQAKQALTPHLSPGRGNPHVELLGRVRPLFTGPRLRRRTRHRRGDRAAAAETAVCGGKGRRADLFVLMGWPALTVIGGPLLDGRASQRERTGDPHEED